MSPYLASVRHSNAGYLGKGDAFDLAIADFSALYADQNERDYHAFTAAVNSGRLTAQTGL
jgi:Uncharacterized protein conserved in bacteria (DUF2252)